MVEIKYRAIKLKRQKVVLDKFDLTIEPGAFCVILGPSGCGKSSLLEFTAGLIPSEHGKIYFDNIDISNLLPVERKIGYVFQDYALYPNMNVYQNIEFGLKLQKISTSERREKISNILDIVKLSNKQKCYINELSGGEKQRVAIARSLVLNPKVMLMDEPLSSLDAHLRTNLGQEIRQLHNKYRYTTIYVTHDQSEALTLADQIVIMNQGEIMQIGTPQEVYHNPENLFVIEFFNAQQLNKFNRTNVEQIGIKVPKTVETIIVKPSDIVITDGGEYLVETIELKGEYQFIHLQLNDIKLIVSLLSSTRIELKEKKGIEIKNYYCFDKFNKRIYENK